MLLGVFYFYCCVGWAKGGGQLGPVEGCDGDCEDGEEEEFVHSLCCFIP